MTRPHVENVLAQVAPDLLGYFLRRTTDPEDAADLVGETLAAAWRSARRMPSEPEKARMWVFGVARNTLHRHARGRRRRDALTVALAQAITEAEADHDGLDVRLAVAKLPTEHAELVRLVHWMGSLWNRLPRISVSLPTPLGADTRAKALLHDHLAIPTKGSTTSPVDAPSSRAGTPRRLRCGGTRKACRTTQPALRAPDDDAQSRPR